MGRVILGGLIVAAIAGCAEGATAPDPPAEPASLEIVSGEDQVTIRGAAFPEPVVVRVTDEQGDPIASQALSASVVLGDGWVLEQDPRTGSDGAAHLHWYAGAGIGIGQTLRISAGTLTVEVGGEARTPEAGVSYMGLREWVEYIPGTLPFVVTAPHGGTLEPQDIPDRTWGTFVRDFATDDVAVRVAGALEGGMGARPHLILLHLHRRKLDANRDLDEAAQGNPLAERAWREFHHWTETALASVGASFGTGFYMDLHGHSKHDDFELGYLLTGSDLQGSDASLNGTAMIQKSSLRTLAESSPHPFSSLVRGEGSLGALYEAEGYTAVPGPERPRPAGPFFSGGYNTRRHGCQAGGPICGYQLELNRVGVRDTPEHRAAFAEAHARVMGAFFELHFQFDDDGEGH